MSRVIEQGFVRKHFLPTKTRAVTGRTTAAGKRSQACATRQVSRAFFFFMELVFNRVCNVLAGFVYFGNFDTLAQQDEGCMSIR